MQCVIINGHKAALKDEVELEKMTQGGNEFVASYPSILLMFFESEIARQLGTLVAWNLLKQTGNQVFYTSPQVLVWKVLKLGRGHESDVRIADVSISRFRANIRGGWLDISLGGDLEKLCH